MTDVRGGQREASRLAGGRSDRRRATIALVAGVAVLLLMSLGFVLAGTTALSAPDALSALLWPQTMSRAAVSIVWQLRLPRLVAALVCGSALAVSGLLLQAALGNRLASPSIMGVNAGAGLAVLISGLAFPLSVPARQAMALAGALLATLLVTLVSRRAGVSRTSLVLAGVAISSLLSAVSDVIVTIRPDLVADRLAFRLGGLAAVSWPQLCPALLVVVAGLTVTFALGGGIDLLALGDETAHGLGLDVRRTRIASVVTASALASAAVSVCGLLGFVGLIVPNLVRMVLRGGFRGEALVSLVWGASLLVTCDLAGRLALFPYELPVGLMLSLLGTPFFIALLMRGRAAIRR